MGDAEGPMGLQLLSAARCRRLWGPLMGLTFTWFCPLFHFLQPLNEALVGLVP